MQIVIDMPEGIFESVKRYYEQNQECYALCAYVANGTPLPEGHGRLIDADKFLEKVKKDREHEIYLHSWTADMVLERLDSWYASTIIEADKAESEEK